MYNDHFRKSVLGPGLLRPVDTPLLALSYLSGVQEMHQGLHYSVVGGVLMRVQREVAFTAAVEGPVAIRSNDPILEIRLVCVDKK